MVAIVFCICNSSGVHVAIVWTKNIFSGLLRTGFNVVVLGQSSRFWIAACCFTWRLPFQISVLHHIQQLTYSFIHTHVAWRFKYLPSPVAVKLFKYALLLFSQPVKILERWSQLKTLDMFTRRKTLTNLIKFSTDCSLTFMSTEKNKYKQYRR